MRRDMEDPEAWEPRKAWHLHVKEKGHRNPPSEEQNPKPSSHVGGCQVSQWSGPGPGPRMECARKHLGKGLEKASEGGRLIGREMVSP